MTMLISKRKVVPLAIVAMLLPIATASAESDSAFLARARSLFAPLPPAIPTDDNPLSPEKVALGRMLFFEPRVSLDGTVSCARCHQPALYGTDALPRSIGVQSRVNPRNAPTVLNAALEVAAHWRGDRKSVEDQATQALVGPGSFGNPTYEAAVAKLRVIPGYADLFAKAFPGEREPVTPENWGKAIGAYERTLVTPARFDAFLAGDTAALTPHEREGLGEFLQLGCAGCHDGVGVGGAVFRKFGLFVNYWEVTRSANVDKGRFDVTHRDEDLYVFRVPSLRNVAMTPPYFHDGSVATLPEAVRVMAKVQLGRTLSDAQVDGLVAFLGSLTGPLPDGFATAPVLPGVMFRPLDSGR